jgi:hypothetical protein
LQDFGKRLDLAALDGLPRHVVVAIVVSPRLRREGRKR